MSEKMLVTQALDERDLLVKKIGDKIAKANFVDTIRPNEDKVYARRVEKAEFTKEAKAAYQQITDLIARYQKIDAAIVDSNARTEVKTSYGTFTVAGAISLRSRLRGLGVYEEEADFERNLQKKLRSEYEERVRFCDMKNSQLQTTAENMRLSILGRDAKTKDEKPLGEIHAWPPEGVDAAFSGPGFSESSASRGRSSVSARLRLNLSARRCFLGVTTRSMAGISC